MKQNENQTKCKTDKVINERVQYGDNVHTLLVPYVYVDRKGLVLGEEFNRQKWYFCQVTGIKWKKLLKGN